VPHLTHARPKLSLRSSALALAAVLGLTVTMLPGHGSAQQAESRFSEKDKAEIEAIVRDYILQNPEIILESVAIMQARQKADEDARAKAALGASRELLVGDDRDPVLGNPEGSVTVVEFFDYQCGYCKSMLTPIMKVLRSDGDVRMVLKEFPILGEASVFAARASLAAQRQGKYEDFHVELLGLRGRLSEDAVLQVAREVGLDLKQLQKDMNDPAIEAHIRDNYELAQTLSIEGTPAFVVGDRLVPGAVNEATLAAMVKRVRETATQ